MEESQKPSKPGKSYPSNIILNDYLLCKIENETVSIYILCFWLYVSVGAKK